MFVLVTYDVNTQTSEGQQRLRRVARICMNYGVRVQHSVFECDVTPAMNIRLQDELVNVIDPNTDSLRFYSLGADYISKIRHFGVKKSVELSQTLIY